MQAKSSTGSTLYALNSKVEKNVVKTTTNKTLATRYCIDGTRIIDSTNSPVYWYASSSKAGQTSFVASSSMLPGNTYAALSCSTNGTANFNTTDLNIICTGPGNQAVFQTCPNAGNHDGGSEGLIVASSKTSASCTIYTFVAVDYQSTPQLNSNSSTNTTAPACVAPDLSVSACPKLTGNGQYYKNVFSGILLSDPATYKGNNYFDSPPVYIALSNSYSACAAATVCADKSWTYLGSYYSFDLHFFKTSCQWECVSYWNQGSSADFKIVSSDALVAYGYST